MLLRPAVRTSVDPVRAVMNLDGLLHGLNIFRLASAHILPPFFRLLFRRRVYNEFAAGNILGIPLSCR